MFFILALGPLSGNLSLPGCSQARIKNILHGGKKIKNVAGVAPMIYRCRV